MAETSIRPASFSQKRLWFLDQFDPGLSAYNLPRAFRITGEFKVEALQNALEMIVERHESLRTTFAAFDGDPVQVVHTSG
ncbi:MAG: condensation domain-containing protein, partial [Bryobacteraceae bacterium]